MKERRFKVTLLVLFKELPGAQVRNADVRQQMVHLSSLFYKDLILRHFVMSSTSVTSDKLEMCVHTSVLLCSIMSKFTPNKEHSRTALICCFHFKKTAVE